MRTTLVIMAAMVLVAACRTPETSRDTGPWTLFFDEDYLLKTGEKVGIGCLYLWDNTPDCESEGKIRFRDAATDKVGFFDGRGQVAIPAEYSDAQPFRNNLALVLKGAKRVCPDGRPWSTGSSPCEHWQWQGGRMILIDAHNQVMIDDFPYTDGLDWFSLTISEKRDPDPLRESFKATDGRYWSFVRFEKAFRNWLESEFLASHTPEDLERCAFDEMTFWAKDADEWQHVQKKTFLEKNAATMLQVIGQVRSGALDHAIMKSPGLNPYIFQGSRYAAYFDTCSKPMKWTCPVFELVVSYDKNPGEGGGFSHQDRFEFLRTIDGDFRLISVSIRSSL